MKEEKPCYRIEFEFPESKRGMEDVFNLKKLNGSWKISKRSLLIGTGLAILGCQREKEPLKPAEKARLPAPEKAKPAPEKAKPAPEPAKPAPPAKKPETEEEREVNVGERSGSGGGVVTRSYSQPCGTPIPPGATCTCNCIRVRRRR
jgi:hypothetical protein